MEAYWKGHADTKGPSLHAMMLDRNADQISEAERNEVMANLPDIVDKDIVELGAGIGRFTPFLAEKAKSVLAVEFIQQFTEKNVADNTRQNVKFFTGSALDVEIDAGSVDVVFSNWLMMYLTEEEVQRLTMKVIKWLRPGGHFVFRESCYHQSGNRSTESVNPTIYRKPMEYTSLVTSIQHKTEAYVEGLDLVYFRAIETYVKLKNNKNQICWLLQKSRRDIEGMNHGMNSFQQFLDEKQYSKNGVLRYEKIFGQDYVSSGGLETTTEFCRNLNLTKGTKVLDIGAGIGGSAFHMNQKYGCQVIGIDLSVNMIEIALERLESYGYDNIRFEVADATKREFPALTFDLIYSRDTILHISDKLGLFKQFYKWCKPGGQVFITDYCAGPKSEWDEEFSTYVASRGYDLHTPAEYGKILESAGFTVNAIDYTKQWRDVLESEVAKIEGPMKHEFLEEFTEKDLKDLVDGWKVKLDRVDRGHQRWGVFYAKKAL